MLTKQIVPEPSFDDVVHAQEVIDENRAMLEKYGNPIPALCLDGRAGIMLFVQIDASFIRPNLPSEIDNVPILYEPDDSLEYAHVWWADEDDGGAPIFVIDVRKYENSNLAYSDYDIAEEFMHDWKIGGKFETRICLFSDPEFTVPSWHEFRHRIDPTRSIYGSINQTKSGKAFDTDPGDEDPSGDR